MATTNQLDGPPTGVMASEFTHPYYDFLDAGIQVDLTSIQGGPIPIDPQTLNFIVRSPEDESTFCPAARGRMGNPSDSHRFRDADAGFGDAATSPVTAYFCFKMVEAAGIETCVAAPKHQLCQRLTPT